MSLRIFTVLYLLFTVFACTTNNDTKLPDVSSINPEFKIERVDQLMMEMSLEELNKTYPVFSDILFKNVIPVYRSKTPSAVLDTIVSEPQFEKLVDTCQIVFGDMKDLKESLNQSFKYLEHYVPQIDVPDIFTFVSGFAHQLFIFELEKGKNGIGVGIDMFLGSTFPYQSINPENAAFSNYLTRSFNKDHLPKRVIEVLLDDYLPKPQKLQLLDQMIRNGKKLYLIDKILPTTSDTIKMEYSKDQMEWVEENTLEMWAYFLKEKLFYESNSQKINKYINPSPHSPGMPPRAPGRTGNYLGWQIVDTYMERFPKTTIDELIGMNDAQQFLQQARYKPSRK